VCGQPFSGLGGDGIDGLVECQINNRFSYSSTLRPSFR
jgi:hypothetical protein